MSTQNVNQSAEAVATPQITGLTEAQARNLTARLDSHIEVRDDKIVDTLNNIELDVTVENGKVYVSSPFGDSFSVQVDKLNDETIKNRKKKVLADKTNQVISNTITHQSFQHQVNADIKSIEPVVKQRYANQLGKFDSIDYSVNDDNSIEFTVKFASGEVTVIKHADGKFRLTTMTKVIDSELEVKAEAEDDE